ncbi:MAG: phospho-sugar mutase [Myxococcota bacterium]|jgi:phosphomannomutase|nr:phospho-sugar mutase [Myxococcota bacterium]
MSLRDIAFAKAQRWTQEPFDPKTRAEVTALLGASDETPVIDRFAEELEFGTAGLRGVLGVGSAMMNVYTVAQAARGIADAIVQDHPELAGKPVVIGYDCRLHSDTFAWVCAEVICAAGLQVLLYDRLGPTPLVPFSIRRHGAAAGIVITSSHNPKQYNGLKVFAGNGAQIVSPFDKQVSARIAPWRETPPPRMAVADAVKGGQLSYLGEEEVSAYLRWVVETATPRKLNRARIVYTPLRGTGYDYVARAFAAAGFDDFHVVPEERDPDPDFGGLSAPNPERPDVWERSFALAKSLDADIILATDGDADRVGVAVPDGAGGFVRLSGNQIGTGMLDYLLAHRQEQGGLDQSSFAVCSVVSSPLTRAICEGYGIRFHETLTGFKWMGNLVETEVARGQRFVLAYEEAFGVTFGDSRDKDGLTAILLFAEMAALAKLQGRSMLQGIDALHLRFGIHLEAGAERFYEGVAGKQVMRELLARLREQPPAQLAGVELSSVRDLLSGQASLPPQDMLTFYLRDGAWVSIRPSGTEPKIKAYLGVIRSSTAERFEVDKRAAQTRLDELHSAVEKMLIA